MTLTLFSNVSAKELSISERWKMEAQLISGEGTSAERLVLVKKLLEVEDFDILMLVNYRQSDSVDLYQEFKDF